LTAMLFESIVEKVTVGDSTDPAQSDPHRLMFIYKTGFTNLVESKIIKQKKSFGNKRGGSAFLYFIRHMWRVWRCWLGKIDS